MTAAVDEAQLGIRWETEGEDGSTPRQRLLASFEEARRKGGGRPPGLPSDLRAVRLAGVDLSGLDLSGVDLTGADLSHADLSRARLVGAKLRDAALVGARLDEAQLLKADLEGADLTDASAERAGFGGANLKGATLFNASLPGAVLSLADLRRADLGAARLRNARMLECDLREADLSRADLRGVDLERSRVDRARFADADLRGARVRGVSGYTSADWIGADIVDVDFCGAYLLRRAVIDQNYLHEFRHQSRMSAVLYWGWKITSDCGRSFLRWALWTVGVAVGFAWLYQYVAVDYGEHPTPLSALYYSVVTLTTLGYGDVVPASPAAQVLAMIEVVIGYVMLGGLLSIFANKMARRAD